jgi:hypothetical protein
VIVHAVGDGISLVDALVVKASSTRRGPARTPLS